MHFLNKGFLLLIATSLLSGCGNSSKTALVANSDFLLYGEVKDESVFYAPSLEEFNNLYNSNLSYVVYFTEEGCSACQQFKSIIENYAKESHQLIVTVNDQNRTEIEDVYKSKFFANSQPVYPTICVKEENEQIYTVDYASYMKTYNVFKRHMDSRYETAKYSCFSGEIATKSWINKEFSYLKISNNDIYKNNVFPLLKNTKKDVVFSFTKETMHASIIGRNDKGELYSKDEMIINEKTSQENLSKFL